MLKARYLGQRVTSKFCPPGFAEMPADFVNAYVLGSLGATGASLGACASFLYNLRHGVEDIRSGRARIAFVGAAEAPITPEVMEGYNAMGALASRVAAVATDTGRLVAASVFGVLFANASAVNTAIVQTKNKNWFMRLPI